MWPLTYGSGNENAVDSSNSRGVSITSGAQNTKGGYSELIASTAIETTWVMIEIHGANTTRWNVDISVGAALSEEILIPDLCVMIRERDKGGMSSYQMPLSIPKGSRISARCASAASTASRIVYVALHLFAGGWDAHSSTPRKYTAYNILASDSYCSAVDPGAVADTKGNWLEVSSSTIDRILGFCLFVNNRNNTAATDGNARVDVGVGSSGNEEILLEDMPYDQASAPDCYNPTPMMFIPLAIPAGSRIALRCQSQVTDATDRLIYVAMYAGK